MEKLPQSIYEKLEDLSSKYSFNVIKDASSKLFNRYTYKENTNQIISGIDDDITALTYGLTRFPSTFSTCYQVIKNTFENIDTNITSINDFGFGLGAASLASYTYFKKLDLNYFAYEKSMSMINIAKCILPFEFKTYNLDLNCENSFIKSDLSIISYCACEINKNSLKNFVLNVLKNTDKVVIFIEPGTQSGFLTIAQIKEIIKENNWTLISPCNNKNCPLQQNNQYCHFSLRIERYKLEKILKGGDFGFQDEKYIYISATKNISVLRKFYTIIKTPKIFTNGIKFEVCDEQDIKTLSFYKNKHKNYKHFKKLTLGDKIYLDEIF